MKSARRARAIANCISKKKQKKVMNEFEEVELDYANMRIENAVAIGLTSAMVDIELLESVEQVLVRKGYSVKRILQNGSTRTIISWEERK